MVTEYTLLKRYVKTTYRRQKGPKFPTFANACWAFFFAFYFQLGVTDTDTLTNHTPILTSQQLNNTIKYIMPVYLKQVQPPSEEKNAKTSEIVSQILQDIEKGGEQKVYEYAAKFDGYTVGETEAENSLILSQLQIEEKIALVPEQIKTDIQFAYGNIKKFAEMQRSCIQDMQFETSPGFLVGQKCIPLESCGAYVPGGRYSHIASALMTV